MNGVLILYCNRNLHTLVERIFYLFRLLISKFNDAFALLKTAVMSKATATCYYRINNRKRIIHTHIISRKKEF